MAPPPFGFLEVELLLLLSRSSAFAVNTGGGDCCSNGGAVFFAFSLITRVDALKKLLFGMGWMAQPLHNLNLEQIHTD